MNEIDRLVEKLEDLPETLEQAATEQAERELEKIATYAKRNLRRHGTWWQGDIGNSFEITSDENAVWLSVLAGHAAYVEYGTGAYFGTATWPMGNVSPFDAPSSVSESMIDNLTEWVQTKPVSSRYYDSDRDLAFAIAHTIVELGTQAQPYLRPAWWTHRETVIRNIDRAVRQSVEEHF